MQRHFYSLFLEIFQAKLHLCPEMQVNEIQCSLWISITKCHFHIWQNYVCFGDFLGKMTLRDACHKEHASHQPASLDISAKLASSSLHEHASVTIKQCGLTWTCRHNVDMSTFSPCLWLQLVTEVPMGIWIWDEFKPKIDRTVKAPWQEYGLVAGS